MTTTTTRTMTTTTTTVVVMVVVLLVAGGGEGDRQRHLHAMLEVAAVTFVAAMSVDDSLDGGGSANGIGDNR